MSCNTLFEPEKTWGQGEHAYPPLPHSPIPPISPWLQLNSGPALFYKLVDFYLHLVDLS